MLIEVNCETDFVAKGDRFKELVADLAMQVCAQCSMPTLMRATMVKRLLVR